MLLLATVIGLSLVVASGCVLNNCIDRDIDRHMERTRGRVTVTGQISLKAALAHGLVLGVAGFGLLWWRTNPLTTALAGFGYFVYVGLYSLWFKRRSQYGTLVGSLSGAMPPVVGYCAVSGQFDAGAASLLAIFCLWQMPHSYAIAIFRLKDYEAAGIPVLPVARGIAVTKIHIVLYILAFMAATLALCLRLRRLRLPAGGGGGEPVVAGHRPDRLLDCRRPGLGAQAVRLLHRRHHRAERDDVHRLPGGARHPSGRFAVLRRHALGKPAGRLAGLFVCAMAGMRSPPGRSARRALCSGTLPLVIRFFRELFRSCPACGKPPSIKCQ